MLNSFLEIFKYSELLRTLVSRDLKLRYKSSVLGYAWTWLDPLMTMFVFILVFQYILAIKVENFPVYLLTGLIPWIFFSKSVNGSLTSIISNAGLIRRVYYPREIFPLTVAISSGVNLLLSLVVLIPIILAFGLNITLNILLLPIVTVFLFLFAFGIGLVFSFLTVFMRDMLFIGPFVMQLWFFLSPVFYNIEGRVPERYIDIYMTNPMAVLISLYRTSLMGQPLPEARYIFTAFAICILTFLAGYVLFKKKEDLMVKSI